MVAPSASIVHHPSSFTACTGTARNHLARYAVHRCTPPAYEPAVSEKDGLGMLAGWVKWAVPMLASISLAPCVVRAHFFPAGAGPGPATGGVGVGDFGTLGSFGTLGTGGNDFLPAREAFAS